MAGLELKHMYKIYPGDVAAVKDFNLKVDDKEFIVFVGPSGCGKSTTLRMIAGLEDISKGELYIDGKLMNDSEPKDRDIAMVFQSYALYPHMSVYENMAFALTLRKVPKDEIKEKVLNVAKSLELETLLKRKPKDLSGGQRQRVALGRAIVRNPKVFLMDEPLSNLDTKLRVQMRKEISRLHKELETTFIYVTHDQVEAMTMGTRIVVMKDGVVQQVATPTDLYEKPKNKFVASFIGSPQMNFVEGKISKGKFYNECMMINLEKDISEKNILLGFRPEDIVMVDENEDFTGKVELCELMGSETYIHFKTGKCNLIVKVKGTVKLEAGDLIKIALDKNKVHIFNKETEEALSI